MPIYVLGRFGKSADDYWAAHGIPCLLDLDNEHVQSAVVYAPNEMAARMLVASHDFSDTRDAWLDPERTLCEKKTDPTPEILLARYGYDHSRGYDHDYISDC